MMSSTCFEPEGSSSGRRLYIQVRRSRNFSIENTLPPTRLLILIRVILYHTCMYNRLPEDEPSGSKHAEDMKLKYQFIKRVFC